MKKSEAKKGNHVKSVIDNKRGVIIRALSTLVEVCFGDRQEVFTLEDYDCLDKIDNPQKVK